MMSIKKKLSTLLKIRKRLKRKKPGFKRQESFKHSRLGESWRRPRGRHSKLRKGEKARGKRPSVGYSSPKEVRGLNRLGYREVRVFNARDLEKIDPEKEMAVIAGGVGKKKRTEILKKAEEMKIKIANL